MPFAKKIELENGVLAIWELAETVDSLKEGFEFSEEEVDVFKKFKFEKRQSEFLASRLLLQQIYGKKTEIIYQKTGRPLIKNSTQHLSISHSAEFVAIFISNELVGVDVENAKRNIDKVANRFLNKKELEWIEKTENQQFLKILFWCAKEAIYKCACQPGIQFDTQIFIPPFDFVKTDIFSGNLNCTGRTESYKLQYLHYQNNIVVYCIEVKK